MPTLDLVGSAEAAKLLEIGPTNFSHLRKKMTDAGDESFPEPIAKLQCGPIWRLSDMNKFKKHYDSRRRRVRSSNGDATASSAPAPVKATKAVAKATKAVAKTPAAKRTAKQRNTLNSKTATVATIGTKPKRTFKVKAGV
jgi:hypothetical protein